MHRLFRIRFGRFMDFAVPLGVGAFLVLTVLDPEVMEGGPPKLLGIALAVAQGVALWWRRSRPELVSAVVLGLGLAYLILVPEVVLPIAGFFAVGSLAAVRTPRVSLVGLAGLLALSAVNFFLTNVEETVFTMGLAVGAWALGEAQRNRRIAIDEAARRATTEEKARIARELHDIIAHSVSVIVVQSSAADHVFDDAPEQARAALRSIEAAARDAQRELQRLLADVWPGGRDDSPYPQPGLDRLDELAVPLRAAGLRVEVRREGAARALPAGVDLSAYRIVQEALTNTLRHARATRAEVIMRYSSDALELTVFDDGRAVTATSGDGGGYGIAGMRERVAMLGGSFDAGPLPGGGYRVGATLPLEPTS